MAVKDSGVLAWGSRYNLGEYSFRIERSSVPGSTNDKIEAICTKGGKNARKSIQVPSSDNVESWYVEANETEATVYALVEVKEEGESGEGYKESAPLVTLSPVIGEHSDDWPYENLARQYYYGYEFAYPGFWSRDHWTYHTYVWKNGVFVNDWISNESVLPTIRYYSVAPYTSYSMVYKTYWTRYEMYHYDTAPPEDIFTTKTYLKAFLVGRFAIDLEDAGGVGPGSDWIDPGDYDPGWEPEDPTHTLYVTVTGALSGRHNDPIVDPSYSYIPSDKDTIKDYGCGGDGGNGGGGGAGASTVVVHKFATNQANYKEVTAIARRHGYGSGGGKGGKGGDGCILVYY